MTQSAAVGLERTPELLWPWRLSFALIWERVGVLEESIKGSATQYRPCCLPPPALMAASPLMASL